MKTIEERDFVPVLGADLPPSRVREDVSLPSELVARSNLDKHLLRLLALHPEVTVAFRNSNLSQLDESTKQSLVNDINQLLGIKPLKK